MLLTHGRRDGHPVAEALAQPRQQRCDVVGDLFA
jgi:hypothetical protein